MENLPDRSMLMILACLRGQNYGIVEAYRRGCVDLDHRALAGEWERAIERGAVEP
ncbi:hypothetical protein KIF59_00385 [Enterobacter cloacae subsp. cloacae]|nr:hypothetical protein [Enterobacter cloacae subsp. cloacae]